MAAESIGAIYSTKIPGYSDNADIQAAFKLYHYGSLEYDSTQSNVANLVNPSIAYTLNDIQSQITALDPAGGISKSIINAKGDLIVGSANDAVSRLGVGSNNFVLVADSAQTLGIKWAAPEITASNTVTFTNKSISLTTNTLTGTKAEFNSALTDADFATIAGTETLTNKTLTSPVLNTATISLGAQIDGGGYTYKNLHPSTTVVTASATPSIAVNTHSYYVLNNSANTVSAMTISFTGISSSGTAHAWQVEVDRGSGALALTWPAAVVWDGGTAPSTTASKKTVFTFLTRDGGTTIYGGTAFGAI